MPAFFLFSLPPFLPKAMPDAVGGWRGAESPSAVPTDLTHQLSVQGKDTNVFNTREGATHRASSTGNVLLDPRGETHLTVRMDQERLHGGEGIWAWSSR